MTVPVKVKDLIELLACLKASVMDDEIEGCTLDEFESMDVFVRVQLADGTTTMGALADASIDAGCSESEALILDGEG